MPPTDPVDLTTALDRARLAREAAMSAELCVTLGDADAHARVVDDLANLVAALDRGEEPVWAGHRWLAAAMEVSCVSFLLEQATEQLHAASWLAASDDEATRLRMVDAAMDSLERRWMLIGRIRQWG